MRGVAAMTEYSVTYGFVGLDTPDANRATKIIDEVVRAAVHEGCIVESFLAYVELLPEYQDVPRDHVVDGIEGYISRMEMEKQRRWGLLKWRKQDVARVQDPQHKQASYEPARVVKDRSCLVVVGTHQFCATVARAHTKDIPEMREFNEDLQYRLHFLEERRHEDELGESYDGFLMASTDHMHAAECVNYFGERALEIIVHTRANTSRSLGALLAARRDQAGEED